MKLSVLKGDITDQHVDVIVNAATTRLAHGAGVVGAIVKKGVEVYRRSEMISSGAMDY